MSQFNKMFMTQLLDPLKYCKKRNRVMVSSRY